MRVSLNIRVSDSDIEEHIRKTGMTQKTIVKFMRSEALKAAEQIVSSSLNLSDTEAMRETELDIRDDNDNPYDYITIGDSSIKIVGGLEITEKDGTKKTVILVEDVGIKPLFEIRGKKAIWNGGLSSTAQIRFFQTKEGNEFKYKGTKYRKLRMTEVRKMYEEDKKYDYVM